MGAGAVGSNIKPAQGSAGPSGANVGGKGGIGQPQPAQLSQLQPAQGLTGGFQPFQTYTLPAPGQQPQQGMGGKGGVGVAGMGGPGLNPQMISDALGYTPGKPMVQGPISSGGIPTPNSPMLGGVGVAGMGGGMQQVNPGIMAPTMTFEQLEMLKQSQQPQVSLPPQKPMVQGPISSGGIPTPNSPMLGGNAPQQDAMRQRFMNQFGQRQIGGAPFEQRIGQEDDRQKYQRMLQQRGMR